MIWGFPHFRKPSPLHQANSNTLKGFLVVLINWLLTYSVNTTAAPAAWYSQPHPCKSAGLMCKGDERKDHHKIWRKNGEIAIPTCLLQDKCYNTFSLGSSHGHHVSLQDPTLTTPNLCIPNRRDLLKRSKVISCGQVTLCWFRHEKNNEKKGSIPWKSMGQGSSIDNLWLSMIHIWSFTYSTWWFR